MLSKREIKILTSIKQKFILNNYTAQCMAAHDVIITIFKCYCLYIYTEITVIYYFNLNN